MKAKHGRPSSCLPKASTIPSESHLKASERGEERPGMKMTKEEDTKKKTDNTKEEKRSRGKEEEEKEEGVGKGKTVVIGVKTESQSRELLTWALVKVAAFGDHVVALHVLTSCCSSSYDAKGNGEPAAAVSLAKSFDAVLTVYKGFCNLKQIDLKLKFCKGTSVRKVLAREAIEFTASKLILGVAKHCRSVRFSSFSNAKYCAKKVPSDCSVFAVSNGKTVFQRHTADKNKVCTRILSKDSTSSFDDGEVCRLLPIRGQAGKDADDSNSSPLLEDGSNDGNSAADESATMVDASLKHNCSICESVSEPPSLNESKEGEPLASVPMENSDAPPSCSGMSVVREIPRARPSCMLFKIPAFSSRMSTSSSHEWPKISVSQWALQLPGRHSAAHPCHKFMKPSAKATSNIDEESSGTVPGDTNSSPSVAVHGEERVLSKELESLREKYSSVCRLFSYKELVNTTSNFSPEKLIGKGGCSRVYKGCLSDGREVAVKVLNPSDDALRDFMSEIEIVTTLHHKNIISLIGFCCENNSLILVSDYLSKGSLDEVLHGEKDNKHVLSWSTRYKVALGVAEALDYLHGGSGAEAVIHRDVKSSNILLSEDFEPQLSDFGLAKWASTSTSSPTPDVVAGTFGYLALEYFMYGKLKEKIDVYAFGVVLLELVSGRKPISTACPKGQESLVMWAKPILQGGEVKQLVDPCLGNEYDSDQMERMTLAASLCIRSAHRSRPRIATVLKLLGGDDDVVRWARSQVSSSIGLDKLDDELMHPRSIIQSYLNLALLDVDDDSLSINSTEHNANFITANTSMEDYLKGRWSCSSSID